MQRGDVSMRITRPSHQQRFPTGQVALYALLTLMALIFSLPFLWAIATSLKTAEQLYIFPPEWLPRPISFESWTRVWSIVPLARWLGNSVFVTIFSLVGQLLSGSLVAYGFARFRFPFRQPLFLLVLSALMLPGQVTLIPQYLLFKQLGWIDSYKPLIVPWFFAAGGGGAITIFLLRQFFMTIPLDLDEAAKIDGASYFTIFWRMIIPLSAPILTALAALNFVGHWNNLLGPLIYVKTTEKLTIAPGLLFLNNQGVAALGATARTEHYLMAGSLIAALPCLLLYIVAQRQLIAITITGSKG